MPQGSILWVGALSQLRFPVACVKLKSNYVSLSCISSVNLKLFLPYAEEDKTLVRGAYPGLEIPGSLRENQDLLATEITVKPNEIYSES